MEDILTSSNEAPAASTSSSDVQVGLASNIKIESSVVSDSGSKYSNSKGYDNKDLDSKDSNSSDEEENQEPVNKNCLAVPNCRSGVTDMRKVVSHIFGRNKSCTSQIPKECIVHYCRKHYQRYRYRTSKYGNWINTQLGCVRIQLERMEKWGGVRSWTVGLRFKGRRTLMAEDAAIKLRQDAIKLRAAEKNNNEAEGSPSAAEEGIAFAENYVEPCHERFLVPYLGQGKTFADVHAVVDLIEAQAATFPDIEFLPDIDPQRFPPAGERKRREKREREAAAAVLLAAAAAAGDDDDEDDAMDTENGHSDDNPSTFKQDPMDDIEEEPPHHTKHSSIAASDTFDAPAIEYEPMSDQSPSKSSANAKGKGKVTDAEPSGGTKRSSLPASETSDASDVPHRRQRTSSANKRKSIVLDDTDDDDAPIQPGPTPKKPHVAEASSSRQGGENPNAAGKSDGAGESYCS